MLKEISIEILEDVLINAYTARHYLQKSVKR